MNIPLHNLNIRFRSGPPFVIEEVDKRGLDDYVVIVKFLI